MADRKPGLANSLEWFRIVRRTARSDRYSYQSKNRSISAWRLGRLIVPNLRCPIFIIGAPRSGTTFLGKCLAALPEISYHFEPVATKVAARYVYEKIWGFTKARFFYRQVYGWLMRIHMDGHLRFAEKTPRNCFLVPFLYRSFPDAQFIHIIRDGRDAALSLSKKPWYQAALAYSGKREPGGYPYGPYAHFWVERERKTEFETTTDIHRCIWVWRRHTESALMAAAGLTTAQYYEIRYEALVTNPWEEANRLLKFLDISKATVGQRFHETLAQAVPDPIGKWQQKLCSEQLDQIEAEAGPLLRQLEYLK